VEDLETLHRQMQQCPPDRIATSPCRELIRCNSAAWSMRACSALGSRQSSPRWP
jgi:hypothetical protein